MSTTPTPTTGPRRSALWRWLARLLVVIASVAVALTVAEVGLRAFLPMTGASAPDPRRPRRHAVDPGWPYLYAMNPAARGLSSQGLRDREFALPKPDGVLRILVLGDSIPYGPRVPGEKTFPKVLERELRRQRPTAEVINAGVRGYTTYNELQYYLHRGREFQPDLVVVTLCLNDVSDPQLHWDALGKSIPSVPAEAIPNPRYHREHILPALRFYQLRNSPSLLVRFFSARLYRRWSAWRLERQGYEEADGGRRPIFLSREDTLSIKVLLDPASPEAMWLRRMVDRLAAAVATDGARLVVLVMPLAYQLDAGYPYMPQEAWIAGYCAEARLDCLDALNVLKEHRKEEMFLLHQARALDIWHLTERGHEVVGNELARWLGYHGYL